MLYIEVLLLAIGLSMDSLAVSVTGGAVLKNNCTAGNIIKIASVLGIFQAGMTVIGYTMGLGFEKYICAFDHWIAFTLLLYLGGKMIYDSTKEEEEDGKFDPLCNRTLCGLGNSDKYRCPRRRNLSGDLKITALAASLDYRCCHLRYLCLRCLFR
mgnify:CR=1 FL=1